MTVTIRIAVAGRYVPARARDLVDELRALPGSVVRVVSPTGSESPPRDSRVAAPALSIDLVPRIVTCDGARVALTRREFELLAFLAQRPRRVFSRDQLLRQVWGYETVNGERTVDVHVRRLRAKLGERHGVVETVRGVGYRFSDADWITVVADPQREVQRAAHA